MVEVEDQKKPENIIPLTSPEFLFLLQRMDNLEAKLEAKLREEITGVKDEIAGVRGLVWTAMGLMLGALALTATVIVSLLQR